MSESRGAASVTLDTIIAPVVAKLLYEANSDAMGYDDDVTWEHEQQAHRDVWIERAQPYAEAVTDALLAKGEIRYLADGGTITRNKLREWHPPVICILPERES